MGDSQVFLGEAEQNTRGRQGASRPGNPSLLGVKVKGDGEGRAPRQGAVAAQELAGGLGSRKLFSLAVPLINSCHANMQQPLSHSGFPLRRGPCARPHYSWLAAISLHNILFDKCQF